MFVTLASAAAEGNNARFIGSRHAHRRRQCLLRARSELLDEPSLLLHHLVINQLEGLG